MNSVSFKKGLSYFLPSRVTESRKASKTAELLKENDGVNFTVLSGKNSFVTVDAGRETAGGIKLLLHSASLPLRIRAVFGESISEVCSTIGYKNATNDHALRDFETEITEKETEIGNTGFRFVKIELLSDETAEIENIYIKSKLPNIESICKITTSDRLVNEILETAKRTVILNMQDCHIWDGIKRDRMVWSGDLNQELITALYIFGDNDNCFNSLEFLRKKYETGEWMHGVPSYSAWWIISFLDYVRITGKEEYLKEHCGYAEEILAHFDRCIDNDGNMNFDGRKVLEYYLDWPTYETKDAVTGCALVILLAAKMFEAVKSSPSAESIIKKLSVYTEKDTLFKQTLAFQILAGRDAFGKNAVLEEGGGRGFSTFMAYYILTANARAGGENALEIIKEYFGGMLKAGATSFFEDFDLDWLKNAGRIDDETKENEVDIHGDYGRDCYVGLRHSLCHGWSGGVYAFFIEHIIGLYEEDGKVKIRPHTYGIKEIAAEIPYKNKIYKISVSDGRGEIY